MNQRPLEATVTATHYCSMPGRSAKQVMEIKSEAPPRVQEARIRVRGKTVTVPSVTLQGRTVIRTGWFPRMAAIHGEDLVEGDSIADPPEFIRALKQSDLNADILTFSQRVPHTRRKYDYATEFDNAAVLSISSYDEWFRKTEYSIRKGVRRAQKSGLIVRLVDFSRDFVRAVQGIYRDTAIRQGRPFWHRGKSVEQVELELGDYLERSWFLGAYLEDELVGFVKATTVENTATLTQILSLRKHFDKRPNNALLAKCVELCEQRGLEYLVYGKFVYNDPHSTLTEFKRRVGFVPMELPCYYVPLTKGGRLAVSLGLHRELMANVPAPIIHSLRAARKRWYDWCQSKWSADEAPVGAPMVVRQDPTVTSPPDLTTCGHSRRTGQTEKDGVRLKSFGGGCDGEGADIPAVPVENQGRLARDRTNPSGGGRSASGPKA